MPVIDAHSHIYPDKIACKASSAVGDFYGVDMNAKNASSASMLAACEGSPITHHLVHSVATTPGQVPIINDFIAEQCRAHDNFVGFATMHQGFRRRWKGKSIALSGFGVEGREDSPGHAEGEHGRAHA